VIRVVLAEDTYLTREGIARVIEQAEDLELVAVCEDAEAARNAIDEHEPDVLVTDIRMPPTGSDEGIRLAGELRQTHPRVGVVVLSQHAELLYAMELFDEGTEGRAYLLKERVRDEGELHRAIRDVAVGGTAVDPRIVNELFQARVNGPEGRLGLLTPREHDILRLLAEGRSNVAIASELGLSTRTVEHAINAIFPKLGLRRSDDVNRRVKAALLYLAGSESS
jgi:DNA-binding NarL/FixJ family response regulator